MLAFMVWVLAIESESHIILTMEFRMKERNVFLWSEILWQLRLLKETDREMESILIKVSLDF